MNINWADCDGRCRGKQPSLSIYKTKWGLGLGDKAEQGPGDLSWLDSMPVVRGRVSPHTVTVSRQEGLLSIYRGGKHHGGGLASLGDLDSFRNSEVEDAIGLASLGSGGGGGQGGSRRMSITNAIDILRDRVLRAIKRKQVQGCGGRLYLKVIVRLTGTRRPSGRSPGWSTSAESLRCVTL